MKHESQQDLKISLVEGLVIQRGHRDKRGASKIQSLVRQNTSHTLHTWLKWPSLLELYDFAVSSDATLSSYGIHPYEMIDTG